MNRPAGSAIGLFAAMAILTIVSFVLFEKSEVAHGEGIGDVVEKPRVLRQGVLTGTDLSMPALIDHEKVEVSHADKAAERSVPYHVAPAMNEIMPPPKQQQQQEEKVGQDDKSKLLTLQDQDDLKSQKQLLVNPHEKHQDEQPHILRLQQTLDGAQVPTLTDNSTRIVSYTNTPELDRNLCQGFFNGRTCDYIKGNFTDIEQYRSHSTLVNISFSCQHLFKYSGLGSGNYISAFYGMRMVAQVLGSTDVSILCDDAEERKKELITPWVMGVFPRLTATENATEEMPTLNLACADYKYIPIGYRWRDMQYEMRRMAIAMVGIPSPDHPSEKWAEEHLWSETSAHRHGRNYYQLPTPQKGDTPFFPGTEIDDAMLHFRCGDLVLSNHPGFGFMKFGSFSRHLSPDVRTIGIATQPFEAGPHARGIESGPLKLYRCKKLVMAFVDHLQETFPKARVRIHNDVNETIALTFARMIMANQTVVAITSFGVFPGVTTFGTGYVRKPDYWKAPNRWLLNSPTVEKAGNVRLIDEPVLFAETLSRNWDRDDGAAVIEWMRNYTMSSL